MAILNIGLNNTGHLTQQQARNIAFHMIGGMNIREHALVEAEHENADGAETTMVIETFCDITPEMVYRVAVALNQDCVAYYNTAENFGLLIGPKPYEAFIPHYFKLCDGTALAADPRA